ncbi:hypothetical protein [Microbulbifer pacificus]|uniref:Uncharacterized protein n=1 Tax=Microbulbifer pacificus TaxID=407164 RepID=A0AAU0MY43_9GAMM|nr:hypothetical protein [Microbulbifer pacificus]WOX05130.1 hypothetical protein R5R33_15500 [Microbulbifer pacificus]
MKLFASNLPVAFFLIALGIAIGGIGIYIGETDDAPGAAVIGIILMVGAIWLGIKNVRRNSQPSSRD